MTAYLFQRDEWNISPLGQIIASGVSAALFSQALTWLKEHRREEKNANRDRQFIALQLAVTLERYAIQCARQVSDISDSVELSYQTGWVTSNIPSLPKLTLPDAIEWRWIATGLTSEVLALAPRIDFGNGSIAFILDACGPHDGAEEAQRQCRAIGMEAWRIAQKVREVHGIAPQAYALGKWDFLNTLQSTTPR
ncbi:hypothetical protein [Massilia agri]|uniref:Uncharacterized protein n=1 Tax=Massilia agri TaxID=1886785 RepID=A0ABT2ATJ6_9BURK|nr:hypothetical protein [Massilia agri]MCS0599574.1 hypothetical protein [Massilia agri]